MSGFQSKREAATDRFGITEDELRQLMINALKELNLKVENLKARVEVMEKYQRDDGK